MGRRTRLLRELSARRARPGTPPEPGQESEAGKQSEVGGESLREKLWTGILIGFVSGVLTGGSLAVAAPYLSERVAAGLHQPTCSDPGTLASLTAVRASGPAKQAMEVKGEGVVSYDAGNLVDGNTSTAWVEPAPGLGLGSRVSFDLPSSQDVRLLCIVNGYGKSWDLYLRNSRVRAVEVTTEGGSLRAVLADLGTADHPAVFQGINLPGGSTRRITLRIDSAYAAQASTTGLGYADTCISEVEFWVRP